MVVMMFMLLLATPVPVYAVAAPVTPVFDFNSLINSIKEFATTVQYYQQMTQQIKREYDKMKRATEMISTGKFEEVLQGCMSIANQAAGWGITGEYADQVLGDMSNLFNNTLTLSSSYERIHANFDQSWNSVKTAWQSLDDGGDRWLTGSLNLLDGLGDTVLDATDWTERFTGDMQAVLNPISDLVFVYEGVVHDIETAQIPKLKEKLQELLVQLEQLKRERQEELSQKHTSKVSTLDELIKDVENAIEKTQSNIKELENSVQNSKENALGKEGRGEFYKNINTALEQFENWQRNQLEFSAQLYGAGIVETLLDAVTTVPKRYSFDLANREKYKWEQDGTMWVWKENTKK